MLKFLEKLIELDIFIFDYQYELWGFEFTGFSGFVDINKKVRENEWFY